MSDDLASGERTDSGPPAPAAAARPIEIAAVLREIATALELEGERFRARAYDRAARTIELTPGIADAIREERLLELPGIGPSLARVVEEIASTGTVGLLERLRRRWPPAVIELARLPRVGAVRARSLHESLGPRTLEEIEELCEVGRLRSVPGFGKVSEARVLEAIRARDERKGVVLLGTARQISASLAGHLRSCGAIAAVEVCGPVRRWMEVADRVALAVSTSAPGAVEDRLLAHPLVERVHRADGDRIVAELSCGLRCEVHTAPRARFGLAMIEATGSAAHVAALRRLASARAIDLAALTASDEDAVYRALGLPFLPPEVRDGTDEIAAALAGDRFADLVTAQDVTGAVHCHTTDSDGKNTIEEMARAAESRGLGFLTVTDHSASASYAGGLTVERLRQQWDEIAAVEERCALRILRGTESDILADGRLDYPDHVLAKLDVVIASIHHRHRLDEDAMTRRLVAAMRHPYFKIWGHALGRLILIRDPIPCRLDEVLDAIAASPAAIEINGDPRRLDLDPDRVRRARGRGIRFVLSTDAHSTRQLDYLENAVGIARRARVRRGEVLNALPPEEFARAVRPVRTASSSARKVRAFRTAAPSASLSK